MHAVITLHSNSFEIFRDDVAPNLIGRDIISEYIEGNDNTVTVNLLKTSNIVVSYICNFTCIESINISTPTSVTPDTTSNGSEYIEAKLDVRTEYYFGQWRDILNTHYNTNGVQSTIALQTFKEMREAEDEYHSYLTEIPFTVPHEHIIPSYDKVLQTQYNPDLHRASYISAALSDPLNTPAAFLGDVAPENPWPATVMGCTDASFLSYNAEATIDDGTCNNDVYGCTDSSAKNYSSTATIDDGTCIEYTPGCTYVEATNYNPLAETDDGSCILPPVPGCTNPLYEEYNSEATLDNGTCITELELITHVIPIPPQWSIISTFINTSIPPYSNYSPGEFLSNHLHSTSDPTDYQSPDKLLPQTAIQVIKDISGNFYSSEFGVDLFGSHIDPSMIGYYVFNDTPDTIFLILRGTPVQSNIANNTPSPAPYATITRNLTRGWNIMPAPIYNSVGVREWAEFNDSLNPLFSETMTVIKDISGNFYSPEFSFDSLGELEPGKGYMILVTEPVTVRFSVPVVYGCTDASAINYQTFAQIDDGSCYYNNTLTHAITIPGRDDITWQADDIFGNYKISTYIDLNNIDNNNLQHLIENYLYDEYGTKIPLDLLYKYIKSVRSTTGDVFVTDINTGNADIGTNYDPHNGIGDWNTGDVLIFETAGGQNEPFTLRIDGTPVRNFSKVISGNEFNTPNNVIPVLATASVNITEYFNTSVGANSANIQTISDINGQTWSPSSGGALSVLQPGTAYNILFTDASKSITLNRDIDILGGGVLTANDAATYLPQVIELPPQSETWVSSFTKVYNPASQAPRSVHEVVYNNMSIYPSASTPSDIDFISASIAYVALPSYSESFSKWQTSSYASPNLDFKWDHSNGDGYIIKNRSTQTVYFNSLNPLIQTSSVYTVHHTTHGSRYVTQSLIGALCVEPTPITTYFSDFSLQWITHISSSNNQFWTASGPDAPGTLLNIEPGNAYKITTHLGPEPVSSPSNPAQLTFGNIPTIVNNPPATYAVLTSDDINIVVPESDPNNTDTRHVIHLTQGWNMFSTYIDVSQYSAASQSLSTSAGGVFANHLYQDTDTDDKVNVNSLYNYFQLLKDNDGRAVLPQYDFNGIGNITSGQGYQIKVFQPCKLIFEGVKISPPVLELEAGFNMVAWPKSTPQNILSAIPEEYKQYILLIKDSAAHVYWPEFGFNGIGSFIPGQGYLIKTSQAITIPLS